jgi:hypothetical protein
MNSFKTDITYGGLELEFSGSWVPYRKATLLEPAEGGGFEYYIIKHDDIDITDLLDEQVKERIIDRAAERYIEAYGR